MTVTSDMNPLIFPFTDVCFRGNIWVCPFSSVVMREPSIILEEEPALNKLTRANRIINSSLTTALLKMRGIEATLELSKSPNSKVIIVGGGKDGLPLILNSN